MKLRMTLIAVRTYTFDPANYQNIDGTPMTIAEAIACDKAAVEDNPQEFLGWDLDSLQVSVKPLP